MPAVHQDYRCSFAGLFIASFKTIISLRVQGNTVSGQLDGVEQDVLAHSYHMDGQGTIEADGVAHVRFQGNVDGTGFNNVYELTQIPGGSGLYYTEDGNLSANNGLPYVMKRAALGSCS
jgi:hypothetical protein